MLFRGQENYFVAETPTIFLIRYAKITKISIFCIIYTAFCFIEIVKKGPNVFIELAQIFERRPSFDIGLKERRRMLLSQCITSMHRENSTK